MFLYFYGFCPMCGRTFFFWREAGVGFFFGMVMMVMMVVMIAMLSSLLSSSSLRGMVLGDCGGLVGIFEAARYLDGCGEGCGGDG